MDKVITEAGKKFADVCERLFNGDLSIKDFQHVFDAIEEEYYDGVSDWEDENLVSDLITANALYEPDPQIWEKGLYNDEKMISMVKAAYTKYQRA
jgi:hypothetical protein